MIKTFYIPDVLDFSSAAMAILTDTFGFFADLVVILDLFCFCFFGLLFEVSVTLVKQRVAR